MFLCRDPKSTARTPSLLAIKTVFPELLQDASVLNRFNSEAKLLAPIRHPNVVHLVEWGRLEKENGDGGSLHFMAMEYIEGTSLHVLCRRRRLSFPDILNLSIQIAHGLQATHSAHVLHRDLKPANVMVTNQGHAKIIDFGIAKPVSMNTTDDEHIDRGFKTKTGMVIGTVNYLAPEIIHGHPATEASDIYSLGLLIWELLNGVTPFKSSSLGETMKRIDDETLPWSEALIDLAPPGFIKFISRMTAKDAQKRPATAQIVAEELEKIRSDATWFGSLGRKTRFDLDLRWSEQTIQEIKTHAITDTEIPFVLQEIEDRLIEQDDLRLKSTEAIEVSASAIASGVQQYKGLRYQAALARHQRLKSELGGVTTPALPSPKMPSTSGTRSSRSKTFTSPASTRNLVVGFFAIAILLATSLYFIFRTSNGSADLASEGDTLDNLTNSSVGRSVSLGLKPGVSLVYKIKNESNPNVDVEKRTITQVHGGTITWVLNSATQVTSSRLFFPAEAFFRPVHRDPARRPKLRGQTEKFFPLISGQITRLEFIDDDTESIEDLRCTPMEATREMLALSEQDVWRIECVRIVSRHGRVTHKFSERYGFTPVPGLVIRAQIRMEELDAEGHITRTISRRIDLDLALSTIQWPPASSDKSGLSAPPESDAER